MIAYPNKLSLPLLGDVITRDSAFAQIEGSKLSVDVVTPISGTVIQVNEFLLGFNKMYELEPLMNSAYNGGWMVVVQMSKPEELKSMISAQAYLDLILKTK
jgi:glycine cleavage system H protein